MATWNANLMTLDIFESIFPRGINESTQSHRIVFSAYFDVRLNVPQITGSKLKTKITFPDREFMHSVFLNCCCQEVYMLLKCSRLEEAKGYNKVP